ncbi:hypothetical protein ACFRAQ_36205 [Nocardia sp. NPDC056611]|uniref:hypothetical protein n=1 Tax=Nocardia sp. NPDC056611 TaxID=3345877 RepID=UPI00366E30CE
MTRKLLSEIPFNTVTGHMEAFPSPQSEWRANESFDASLRIVGTVRGQSAARYVAEDIETGRQYPMFMTEMLAIIQTATIDRGVIAGTWIGCKRGANYGIRLESQEQAA